MYQWIIVVCVFSLLTLASVVQAKPEQYPAPAYTIIVVFSDFTVHLREPDGNELFLSRVALPRSTPALPVRGRLVGIQRNPWWYPPPGVRAYVMRTERKMLPDKVSPGPHNPLGVVKFLFEFSTPGAEPLSRMHGTNHPGSIGKRVTSGCIRLRNCDVLALADLVEPLFKAGAEIRVLYVRTLPGGDVVAANK